MMMIICSQKGKYDNAVSPFALNVSFNMSYSFGLNELVALNFDGTLRLKVRIMKFLKN